MQIRYKPTERVELKRGSAQYNMPRFGGKKGHPDYMVRNLIDKRDPRELIIYNYYRPTPGVFTSTISFSGGGASHTFHMPSSINIKFGAKWGEENIPPTIEERGGVGGVAREEAKIASEKAKGGVRAAAGGRSHKAEMAKSGKAFNPYKEYIFEEMQFRQFQFTFTISPANAGEENDIINGIKALAKAMHPAAVAGTKYLKAPDTFDISVNPGDYLVTPKKCALIDLDATYNGDGPWATFKSGNPILYKVSFTFQEVDMLTEGDI